MKKIIYSIPLLSFMVLTSCGSFSRYGKYSFTMGRSGAKETRVGLTINLTNEKDPEGKKEGEKFKMTFEKTGGDSEEEDINYNLEGYYSIVESNKRVKLSTEISIPGMEEKITIPSELLQYIAVTYLEKESLVLKMPVSAPINILDPTDIDITRLFDNDLLHQLVWYGFYFDKDAPKLFWDLRKENYDPTSKTYVNPLPGDIIDEKTHEIKVEESIEGRLGKHPIESKEEGKYQISDMNFNFKKIFSKARVYDKIDDTYKLRGSITQSKTDTGETIYVYNDLNGYSSSKGEEITGYLKEDILGVFKSDEVKFKLGDANIIDKFESVEIPGKEVCTAAEYYEKMGKFVFRDYHEIQIALKKE